MITELARVLGWFSAIGCGVTLMQHIVYTPRPGASTIAKYIFPFLTLILGSTSLLLLHIATGGVT